MMIKFFIGLVIVVMSSLTFAQNEDAIIFFNASEFNGKVLLTWEIEQGNTCNGIQIQRSIDSVNFVQIGSIEGICGSSQSSIGYDFTDISPVQNENNYYRLSLGGIGFSWIVQAYVVNVGANNYLIQPNPISDNSKLLFNNDTTLEYKLIVTDLKGEIVHTHLTTSEEFSLSKNKFERGVYVFTITSDQTKSKIKGKFIVYD